MRTLSEARTQARWSIFTRSFSEIIAKLSCSFSSKNRTSANSSPKVPGAPPFQSRRQAISHPRQLRRVIPHNPLSPHPIGQLPVEIIALIFELGSEDDISFPVIVSHVCRNWRYISLQTPSLWRCIHLGSKEHVWRQRIRRAQACSLDIRLLPTQTVTRPGTRGLQDLNLYSVNRYMKVANSYVQQWRSLDIHFSEYAPHLWKVALIGCASPAPLLEELTLTYRLNDDVQEFSLFAGYAPRLCRATVDGIRLTWTPSVFATLTFLDYTHHGFTSGNQAVYDLISILSVSSRLVELRLLFPRGKAARLPSRPDSVTKRVGLPHLTHICLRVDGSDIPFELAHLVTLISTPSLTTLRLIDLGRSHHSFPSLKSFFYVYALPRTLRYICIAHSWYDPRMIQAMSQALPQLARIHVKRARAPDQVLNMNRRIREIPSSGSGSENWTFGHNLQKPYHIDSLQVNVHYFPGHKSS